MRHAHTTTDDQGKAGECFAIQVSDQANILGVNIDAVVAGEGDADFKFAWQIGRAIHRFDIFSLFNSMDLFTIDPDFMVSLTAWCEIHCDFVRDCLHLCVGPAGCGSGAGHDIAIDIATSR